MLFLPMNLTILTQMASASLFASPDQTNLQAPHLQAASKPQILVPHPHLHSQPLQILFFHTRTNCHIFYNVSNVILLGRKNTIKTGKIGRIWLISHYPYLLLQSFGDLWNLSKFLLKRSPNLNHNNHNQPQTIMKTLPLPPPPLVLPLSPQYHPTLIVYVRLVSATTINLPSAPFVPRSVKELVVAAGFFLIGYRIR